MIYYVELQMLLLSEDDKAYSHHNTTFYMIFSDMSMTFDVSVNKQLETYSL